jgi:hypothetical protein
MDAHQQTQTQTRIRQPVSQTGSALTGQLVRATSKPETAMIQIIVESQPVSPARRSLVHQLAPQIGSVQIGQLALAINKPETAMILITAELPAERPHKHNRAQLAPTQTQINAMPPV